MREPPLQRSDNFTKAQFIKLINDWRNNIATDIDSAQTDLDTLEASHSPTIVTPTLAGSWVDYGGAYEGAQYYKTADGVVHLEGLVKSGSGTIFTLDSGYRPAADHMFSVVGNNAFARIEVLSSGVVSFTTGANNYVQLSGINFLAA